MALDLETEQKLEAAGLVKFFEDDRGAWLKTAKDTAKFVKDHFPKGSKIRRDDVAKNLVPILGVHEDFSDFREEQKLRGKFWIRDFADLIIDRTWDELVGEAK